MDTILRALSVYAVVWLAVRISGKRTLAEITTFDFVLLLIIGDSTQQALIGNDYSITTAITLEAARRLQGLERLEQVKYAVLERSGGITIVPR